MEEVCASLVTATVPLGNLIPAVVRVIDRRGHVAGDDIDPKRSRFNAYVEVRPGDRQPDGRALPLEQALARRLGELGLDAAASGADACAQAFMVSSKRGVDDDTAAKAFLEDAISWLADRYGRENLLLAAVHMDESEPPHSPVWMLPVSRDEATGREWLCARELFDSGSGEVESLERDFFDEIASKHGYTRPYTVAELESALLPGGASDWLGFLSSSEGLPKLRRDGHSAWVYSSEDLISGR